MHVYVRIYVCIVRMLKRMHIVHMCNHLHQSLLILSLRRAHLILARYENDDEVIDDDG